MLSAQWLPGGVNEQTYALAWLPLAFATLVARVFSICFSLPPLPFFLFLDADLLESTFNLDAMAITAVCPTPSYCRVLILTGWT